MTYGCIYCQNGKVSPDVHTSRVDGARLPAPARINTPASTQQAAYCAGSSLILELDLTAAGPYSGTIRHTEIY